MERINWEVCIILKENDPCRGNVELIACKDMRTAISTASKIKCHIPPFNYNYDAIIIQANNGEELLDDCEIRIA